jgi:hypothetical protein
VAVVQSRGPQPLEQDVGALEDHGVAPAHRGVTQGRGHEGLSHPGRDGDRLQQLRSLLPCEVRVISSTHPLLGRLLMASSFRRRNGVLLLVVALPDGSPGTIPAEATNVFGEPITEGRSVVLSADGFRRLHELVVALRPARRSRVGPQTRK